MKNLEHVSEWLERARSSLARADACRDAKGVLHEDVCFDAQQAAEKALKAICIKHDVTFPRTHSVGFIMELLEKVGVSVGQDLKKARILTEYAVETRYPGDYEPVTREEMIVAIELAKQVLAWAEKNAESN